ncbi:MAG: hypothetical protein V3U15_05845 [Nitrospinota bacterium]
MKIDFDIILCNSCLKRAIKLSLKTISEVFIGEVVKIVQTAKQVKHPYIIRNKRITGGVPTIRGTGIRVLDIAIRYYTFIVQKL